jgi:hypothetical protein
MLAMFEHRQRQSNWVAEETKAIRYPAHIPDKNIRKARKMLKAGRTHADVAAVLGCDEKELISKTGQGRSPNNRHGNRVLNVKPQDGAEFDADLFPGEAVHAGFRRMREAAAYYLNWAQATGCPPYSSPC